jgi:hypothetical protein
MMNHALIGNNMKNEIGIENYHSKLLWRDVSITIQIKFAESSLAPNAPPFRVQLGHLMYMESCCNELFEVHKTICVAVDLPQNRINSFSSVLESRLGYLHGNKGETPENGPKRLKLTA